MTCSYDQTHGSIDRVSTIPFHRQYLITAKLVFRTFKKYTYIIRMHSSFQMFQ